MNTQQARALIGETFPQTFNRERFRYFAVNLLNHIDETKAQAWNTTYIKDAFKPHVHKFERLGTYTSPDKEKLDVLIVHLTTESKLGHARTAIRNFVADYLKNRDNKDAALVAFVSRTEKQWRFSYIKMEYAAVEKENGKVGVQTTLTPARRMSYIVGEGESCHTAQSRFIDLLQDTENHPTLAQIETAFSVEAVTTEFFEQYKALFLDLNDELDNLAKKDKTIGAEFAAKKISTADFAKKLMGQIVFLYFLQKKGWLGVPKGGDWGDGVHNFLRQLFNCKLGSYKNFFNDILEPLFYDTLATDRDDAWCKIFKCRIPFLNGGLFEPLRDYDWEKIDIPIPNSLFSNTNSSKAGDIGTGILDVFDRYNFTVNEAEPLEKEVAIDPEMLGKVFEKLLDVKERKSKGSFYTPREIVHYMCQESLINYLDTALNTDKEIVPRKDIETFIYLGEQISHYEAVDAKYPIKMPANIEKYARLFDEKLATITVCDPAIGSGAFPVGMMQEIVRARSSLTNYFNDVAERAARTAYCFKWDAIHNSIYGVDIDPGAVEIAKLRLWLSLVVDEEDVKQIKPLPNLDYKIVVGNSLLGVEKNLFNQELFGRLEELKPKYFDESHKKKKSDYKREIDDLIHELTDGKETFDFEIYFSEVFHKRHGFDVFIANPPWVFARMGDFEKSFKQLLTDKYLSTLKGSQKGRANQSGKINLFAIFILEGLRSLTPNGVLTYIVPNTLLRATTYDAIRKHILDNYTISFIADLSAGMFDNVTASSVIISVNNDKDDGHHKVKVVDGLCAPTSFVKAILQREFLNNVSFGISISAVGPADDLLKKIGNQGERLDKYCTVSAGGIATGPGKNDYIASSRLTDKYKPLIEGRHVKPYHVVFGGKYILYDRKKLYRARDESIFLSPRKLITQRIAGSSTPLVVAYDDEQFYTFNSTNCILPGAHNALDLRYLAAILNSRLLNWYYYTRYTNRSTLTVNISKTFLEQLPVKEGGPQLKAQIVGLVEQILVRKKPDPSADVSAVVREIDELVYSLYGLTQEEIALIESAI